MISKLKVIELFAGIGGFRLALEGWKGKSPISNYKENHHGGFKIIWSNQWEPSTKMQHASMVYCERWGANGHTNQDINLIETNSIPDHDVLVAGFPCQDYSVASTLKNSKGLLGKKGVLWWSIHKIISEKENKPKYLILENVDRLITSPAKQRGRDFAIILKSLSDLGYNVEWKIINAAEYGMPQKRKRTFILAYRVDTKIAKMMTSTGQYNWIVNDGVLANSFPSTGPKLNKSFNLDGDVVYISENFNKSNSKKIFGNHGCLIESTVTTIDLEPLYDGPFLTLGSILQKDNIPKDFLVQEKDLDKWKYLKGGKKHSRTTSDGYSYEYSEGSMTFPDALDRASRTIITGEGGSSPSRFKHVVDDKKGLRRLTPVELERLNMFPDDFTFLENVSDTKRAFLMGNALVVGVVEKIGQSLLKHIKNGTDK